MGPMTPAYPTILTTVSFKSNISSNSERGGLLSKSLKIQITFVFIWTAVLTFVIHPLGNATDRQYPWMCPFLGVMEFLLAATPKKVRNQNSIQATRKHYK